MKHEVNEEVSLQRGTRISLSPDTKEVIAYFYIISYFRTQGLL